MKQRVEHEGKRTEKKSSQRESLVWTLLKVLPLGSHYSLRTLDAPWCLDLCSAVKRVVNEASQWMVPRSQRDEGSSSVQPGVWERAADPWKERWLTVGNLGMLILHHRPHSSASKESACNVGDLIPGLGRSPGEGNGYPLQLSGLVNSMDCLVHGIAKSRTRLSDFHFLSPYMKGLSRQS